MSCTERMGDMFALVGSAASHPAMPGLTLLRYEPEEGKLKRLAEGCMGVCTGAQAAAPSRGLVYMTDEVVNRPGEEGWGGYAMTVRITPVGLGPVWERPTYAPLPAYIAADPAGRFAVVVHHGTERFITRTYEERPGIWKARRETDSATAVLYALEADGRLGELRDVLTVRDEGGTGYPHLHSVCFMPDSPFMLVCDKGLDCIHTVRLDAEDGKLVYCGCTPLPQGYRTRYGVFHREKPWFFCNNEANAQVCSFEYDRTAGTLKLLCDTAAAEISGSARAMAADIKLHPNGETLYLSLRRAGILAALRILPGGKLELIQRISCGGENPRGLCVAPDGRFAFAANLDSDQVRRFAVRTDGTLLDTGYTVPVARPGNMSIFEMRDQVYRRKADEAGQTGQRR